MKKKFTTPRLQMIYNSGNQAIEQLTDFSEKKLSEYICQCTKQTYQINADYILRKIGSSDVIVPIESHHDSGFESTILMPNKTAAFLWETFQQPVTEREAVQKCLEYFDGPADLIEGHVCRFIQELTENGILLKQKFK